MKEITRAQLRDRLETSLEGTNQRNKIHLFPFYIKKLNKLGESSINADTATIYRLEVLDLLTAVNLGLNPVMINGIIESSGEDKKIKIKQLSEHIYTSLSLANYGNVDRNDIKKVLSEFFKENKSSPLKDIREQLYNILLEKFFEEREKYKYKSQLEALNYFISRKDKDSQYPTDESLKYHQEIGVSSSLRERFERFQYIIDYFYNKDLESIKVTSSNDDKRIYVELLSIIKFFKKHGSALTNNTGLENYNNFFDEISKLTPSFEPRFDKIDDFNFDENAIEVIRTCINLQDSENYNFGMIQTELKDRFIDKINRIDVTKISPNLKKYLINQKNIILRKLSSTTLSHSIRSDLENQLRSLNTAILKLSVDTSFYTSDQGFDRSKFHSLGRYILAQGTRGLFSSQQELFDLLSESWLKTHPKFINIVGDTGIGKTYGAELYGSEFCGKKMTFDDLKTRYLELKSSGESPNPDEKFWLYTTASIVADYYNPTIMSGPTIAQVIDFFKIEFIVVDELSLIRPHHHEGIKAFLNGVQSTPIVKKVVLTSNPPTISGKDSIPLFINRHSEQFLYEPFTFSEIYSYICDPFTAGQYTILPNDLTKIQSKQDGKHLISSPEDTVSGKISRLAYFFSEYSKARFDKYIIPADKDPQFEIALTLDFLNTFRAELKRYIRSYDLDIAFEIAILSAISTKMSFDENYSDSIKYIGQQLLSLKLLNSDLQFNILKIHERLKSLKSKYSDQKMLPWRRFDELVDSKGLLIPIPGSRTSVNTVGLKVKDKDRNSVDLTDQFFESVTVNDLEIVKDDCYIYFDRYLRKIIGVRLIEDNLEVLCENPVVKDDIRLLKIPISGKSSLDDFEILKSSDYTKDSFEAIKTFQAKFEVLKKGLISN